MGGLTKTYCLSATVSTTAPAEAQCDQERSKGRGQMTGDPKVSNKITKTFVKTKRQKSTCCVWSTAPLMKGSKKKGVFVWQGGYLYLYI